MSARTVLMIRAKQKPLAQRDDPVYVFERTLFAVLTANCPHVQFSQVVEHSIVWITVGSNVCHWLQMRFYCNLKSICTLIVHDGEGSIARSTLQAFNHYYNLALVLKRPTGLSLDPPSIHCVIDFHKSRQHLAFDL